MRQHDSIATTQGTTHGNLVITQMSFRELANCKISEQHCHSVENGAVDLGLRAGAPRGQLHRCDNEIIRV